MSAIEAGSQPFHPLPAILSAIGFCQPFVSHFEENSKNRSKKPFAGEIFAFTGQFFLKICAFGA